MLSINAHIYKLSFANFAMTDAHKVSVTREPISVVEKRHQLISKLSRSLRYTWVSIFTCLFFR